MEYHQFSNEEVTNLYNRLVAIENRLIHIEGRMDSQGQTDLDKLMENHQQALKKHEEWLSICDKSIKELRAGIVKNVTAKATSEPARVHSFWRFLK